MTTMTTARLIISGICALFGYSAFFAFMILKNYPSAVLGLISGSTDGILCFLHYLVLRRKLREWYAQTDLPIIGRYGMAVATLGLLCLGYFSTIQILRKTPMLPVPGSSVISIVWSIITLRAGTILMIFSIRYQHIDENRLLNEGPPNVEENEGEISSATDLIESDKS